MRVVVVAVGLAACGRFGFDESLTPDVSEQARASLSVGEVSACAIVDGGEVYCWGDGEYGQLGGDERKPAAVPVHIDGIPAAIVISVGRYQGCIVSDGGEVWCWGGNEFGRIVPGGIPTRPTKIAVPAGAIEVSAARDHTCALLASGEVWCWGRNLQGQIGNGEVASEEDLGVAPTRVVGLDDAIHISVDAYDSCALRANGDVLCWGDNAWNMIDDSGQLRPVASPATGLVGATALAVGGTHVCAVIDGRLGCRGNNGNGELGIGHQAAVDTVVFAPLDDVVGVEADDAQTCAVRANGEAWCWGHNADGILGDGTRVQRLSPVRVGELDDVLAISTNTRATCVMRAGGVVSCVGWGARGLLGDGRSAELGPRSVSGLASSTMIAVGEGFSCASDGVDVACWGSNMTGQLGIDSTVEQVISPQVLPFAWPAGIRRLVAGSGSVCALLTNDEVYCWGNNGDNQLGIPGGNLFAPALLPIAPIQNLVFGGAHTCALANDASVLCWGYNGDGQLGDGTMTRRETPAPTGVSADQIVAGDAHTCARLGTEVSCWGANDGGQLGIGTMVSMTTPQGVPVQASAITAGGSATCAERTTGGIACWGVNADNVFSNMAAEYYQPTPIDSTQTQLFTVGAVACIGDTCWGRNDLGQVGAGDWDAHRDPVAVQGVPSGATYASAHTHTCALANGDIYCWGENAFGEIGAGTMSTALLPTNVVLP